MDAVINLKKWAMTFERKALRVIVPLDPAEGVCYTELVHDFAEDNDDLDQIYKIIVCDEDWINPTTDGIIAWDRDNSYNSDSDEELEHWQNTMHEVSTFRCNMMTKPLRCVSTEVRKLPNYDGLTDLDLFLDEFEREVPQEHHFQALELALRPTPAHWWGAHKDNFASWKEYRRTMRLRFGYANTRMTKKYSGKDDPHENLVRRTRA